MGFSSPSTARLSALLLTVVLLTLFYPAGRTTATTPPIGPHDLTAPLTLGASLLSAAATSIPEPTPIPTAIPATATPVPAPLPTYLTRGYAAHYGVGVMARVAANRGIAPQACMISYTEARDRDIGVLWLNVVSEIDGDSAWCLVIDMPQRAHYQNIRNRGIVIELDFETAKRLCNIQRVSQMPPRACPVAIYQ